jgi:hypothetical protein
MVVGIRIRYRSGPVNLYHCCVPKTGSQWIGKILSNPTVYSYSGLKAYNYHSKLSGGYDPRNISDRTFTEPFPKGSVITPPYISFNNFVTIAKPRTLQSLLCDVRSTSLISWYFSMRHSHTILGNIPKLRATLDHMSFHDGILFAMDHLNRSGSLSALSFLGRCSQNRSYVLLVRFEDLIVLAGEEVFGKLFQHCDIRMSRKQLRVLLTKYSFRAPSGRQPGQEDIRHHYRKGH